MQPRHLGRGEEYRAGDNFWAPGTCKIRLLLVTQTEKYREVHSQNEISSEGHVVYTLLSLISQGEWG